MFTSIIYNNSQVTQQWTARYSAAGNWVDLTTGLVVDNSGNVIVTGYGMMNINNSNDYITVKYNSSGAQQWVQTYNGQDNQEDVSWSIAVDILGNIYVTGWTGEPPSGNQDITTIKYSPAGTQLWLKKYGAGNTNDAGLSIAVDGSGNVYVGGLTGSAAGSNCLLIKYDLAGVLQWASKYHTGINYNDAAHNIVIDQPGNIYLTGISSYYFPDRDIFTIKYNSSGDSLWVRRYSGPGTRLDESTDIDIDNSGNSYVTGFTQISDSNFNFVTIKYSSTGSEMWVRTYSAPGINSYDMANSLDADNLGNVYVTGYSETIENLDYDFATIKYNTSGDLLWVRTYNGPNSGVDQANAIAVDAQGNAFVTGFSDGDYLTLRYSSSGTQEWVQRYDGPSSGSDVPTSIYADMLGNVYVTGSSYDLNSQEDFLTIKYSQSIGIKPVSSEIPDKFFLSQNFPNPFNPVTKIKFALPPSPKGDLNAGGLEVRVIIYDILGNEVATLVNEQLNPGTYEVEWEASNFASGIYYYKLISDGFTDTKKMILIK